MGSIAAAAGAQERQLSFDDLGSALSEVTFCVFDLETTGGAESDAITEIGAVKVRGGVVVGEFQTLVNPRAVIPALIAVLTGITNAMVASAPRLAQVLPTFLEFSAGTVWVAHNAAFDTGFVRRACSEHGYLYPRPPVLDTVALARQILLRDEVPNHRLATLARHFRATTTPCHRALADAQATVDVLHGLIERVGNLGVHTLEDLVEFTRRVSPQRRVKRTWADGLPERPGVYYFVCDQPGGPVADASGEQPDRQVLYVGKSVNLRRRVRSYFTAAEKRRRIDEMVRVATGVEAVVCETTLQADVYELRMIAAHAPRYNRRSKFPERTHWVKLTDEPFPRLSLVRTVRDDRATYFGPFGQRQAAEDVVLAIYDAFAIRQCSATLSPRRHSPACALAGMGRCAAPCTGGVGVQEYATVAAQVRRTFDEDARGAVHAVQGRLRRLVDEQRYEEAATIRQRLETLIGSGARFHRVRSLVSCPEIVAARRVDDGWDIHVVRHGRLAGAAHSGPHEVPQAAARALQLTAETVVAPVGAALAASIEETERIADWLEQPGVRLMHIEGDWAWPLHAVLGHEFLVRHALGPSPPAPELVRPGGTVEAGTVEAGRFSATGGHGKEGGH